MFASDGRLASRTEHERLLRRLAGAEAAALFRTHGLAALEVVRTTRTAASSDPDERRHERLMIVELERLVRDARRAAAADGTRSSLLRRLLARISPPRR